MSNKEIKPILSALIETPRQLEQLISEIDPALYKEEIIEGKWSIHENATHVAVGDIYGFQKRIKAFKNESFPKFEPLSGDNFRKDYFINLDLEESLKNFYEIRRTTIELAKGLEYKNWNKSAGHPEYIRYTPFIMLRHLLMHDYWHMYKIEEMGLGIRADK